MNANVLWTLQECNAKGTISTAGGVCKCDEVNWTGALCDQPLGWGAWSKWSGCDAVCGGGSQTQEVILKRNRRTFDCVHQSLASMLYIFM